MSQIKCNFIVYLLVVLTLSLSACDRKNTETKSDNIRVVKVMRIESQASGQIRRIPGTVIASRTADLSFQVPGTVVKINADMGEHVKQDQVIAQLDKTSYELNVHAAKAELARAKANMYTKLELYLARKKLMKNSVVSQHEVNVSKAQYDAALSSVNVAAVKLKLAERSLKQTTLLAPFSGFVMFRHIEPHREVTVGQTLFKIQGEEGFDVEVPIPDTLLNSVQMNQIVNLRIPSLNNLSLKGEVYNIAAASTRAHVYPLEIRVLKPPATLRSGMAAEVIFNFSYKSGDKVAYLVPFQAIIPTDKPYEAYVFLYQAKTSTLKKVKVKAQNVYENQIEVSQGLKPGDLIVIAGVQFLHDGQKVKLLATKSTQ